ncbi:hypothetical protein [Sphingomonas immobilis]|uniref:Uncharacterized protein n=1 Tax=Sphingomonas immobilis TaxID=3063997 RepID=A0ABT8ZZ07_9SPHN|nr:hypothetical protein [Sphingomonas sp. CA1-15]MDO7842815.1 hypothetical protein [Sphingomonas sp. CA1-15]
MTDGKLFVLAIVAMVMCAGIVKALIRAKHGQPIDKPSRLRGHGASDIEAERKIHLLSTENERLVGQVSRLEERIAVLERIATDPAERVAREIDALR